MSPPRIHTREYHCWTFGIEHGIRTVYWYCIWNIRVIPSEHPAWADIVSGSCLRPFEDLWIPVRCCSPLPVTNRITCRIKTKRDTQGNRLINSFISHNRAHYRSLTSYIYVTFDEDNLLPCSAHQGTSLQGKGEGRADKSCFYV